MNTLDSLIRKYLKYNKLKKLPKHFEVLDAKIVPNLSYNNYFNLLLYVYDNKNGWSGSCGYSIKIIGGKIKYD